MMAKCCGGKDKYNAGMLKEPVTFQRKTPTPDGAGGFTEAWAAISGSPDRAMVKAMSGGERYVSSRLEATSSHKVVVRYYDGLTEVDRVVVRSRAYQIRFINNVDFEDRWLEISAEVGVAV